MNQYRCETCKKECKITVVDSDYSKPISFNPKDPIESTEYFVQGISQVGCASHSDFQSGWYIQEKLLCELLAYIHPDSNAGCVIKEKLEELRQVGE